MTAGLRITNDQGFVQIDGLYRNMALVAHGSGYSQLNGSGTAYVFTATYPGGNKPVMAVRTEEGSYFTGSGYLYPNGDWVFSVNTYSQMTAAASVFVEYYIYDTIDGVISSDNYGLRVFNAAGETVFAGGHNYLKIMGAWNGQAPVGPGSTSKTIEQPAGRKYAFVQGAIPYYFEVLNAPDFNMWSDDMDIGSSYLGSRDIGGTTHLEWLFNGYEIRGVDPIPGHPPVYSLQYSILIADVTHI